MPERTPKTKSELRKVRAFPYVKRLQMAAVEYRRYNSDGASRKKLTGLRPISLDYNITTASLSRCLKGKLDITSFNKQKAKLLPSEEEELEQILLESAARGFPLKYADVHRLGQAIGHVRNPAMTLGQNWASTFVERREKLQMHWVKKLPKVCLIAYLFFKT